jgi:RecA/RadA recombinase
MPDSNSRFIALKFLPGRTCDDINGIWGEDFSVASEGLEFLIDRLNEDRDSACAIKAKAIDAGRQRDEVVISTPRFRAYCFPDHKEAWSLVVKNVERSTPAEWLGDRNRGVQFITIWTSQRLDGIPYLSTLLAQIEDVAAGASPRQEFWSFWAQYLDAERKVVDDARSHPGWSYSRWRHGMNGTLEFLLENDQDIERLTIQNRGRVLLDNGESSGPTLEIRGWSAAGYLSVSPVHEPLRPEDLPPCGRLRPDWKGLRNLFIRRFDALQMLKGGNTSLPSLNRILPDGPKDHLAAQPFEPILKIDFDLDQRSAIGKALTPGTLSVVLGPPGTGKTAVIAEVAAQVARQGGRALISSQTNLAVDNALERLEHLDDVFAVRIGNPESVKLGKHLLLDHAGDRYRNRLLERSRKALTEEDGWVKGLEKVAPSDKELDAILEGVRETLRVTKEAERAAAALSSAADDAAKAAKVWQDSCDRTRRLLAEIGLGEVDLASVLQLGKKVVDRGWDAAQLSRSETQLKRAYANKSQLEEFFRLADDYDKACKQRACYESKKEALEDRIRSSKEEEQSLKDKLDRNRRIDWERRNFKGFDWFKAKFGQWKTSEYDLNEIRGKIYGYDRPGAERDLPVAMSNLSSSQHEVAGLGERITKQGAFIGVDFEPSNLIPTELSWRVQRMKGEFEQAQFIADTNGFPLLVYLSHYQPLSSLVYQQEQAEKASEASHHRLAEADARAKEAESQNQAIKEKAWLAQLRKLAQRLGARCAEALADLPGNGEDVNHAETELRDLMRSMKERTERLPRLKEVLAAYHSRLQNAGGDFDEAVLHEANVVAATCTGIAGAKKFDATFDHVLVDEAGRATPLDLLIPMGRGKTITLVGDHFQLLPMYDREVENQLTDKGELKTTLFQRVYDGAHESRKENLTYQYRMAPRICEAVSELFYKKHGVTLEPADEARTRQHPFGGRFGAIHWVKCEGPNNRAIERQGGAPGIRNKAEVDAVIHILRDIEAGLGTTPRDHPYEVGVIAMYRQQVKALEEALRTELQLKPLEEELPTGLKQRSLKIECGTVDSFQGREKDAVIVSVVETNPKKRKFFYDARRLNVALSRSRELLVIIGGIDVLGADPLSPFEEPNPLWDLRRLLLASVSASSITHEVFHAA